MTPYQIETVYTTNTYMAFADTPRSARLIAIYDQRIPELIESGELQQIFERWGAEYPSFTPAEDQESPGQ
ncbi:hypothetical protein GF339_06935 [candidate division KSB3 bacterium]|uniref:Solute-binding protein family 3/N-terminal domain-containing protein n=1 Tax=candidate division KSB3 bacterium TaxID=2044937 RepID=A0A9D5JU62_9BACT|nr:hypothetical protein [candidate division KSB3 bacterium]MBD3324302.1 hypothetical protein [candidate division KSB3 bacterium]